MLATFITTALENGEDSRRAPRPIDDQAFQLARLRPGEGHELSCDLPTSAIITSFSANQFGESLFMSEPRKHHYIPVFYLKQWAGQDRQVCGYRVQPGKIVSRRKFPDGTGYKHDLYRIDGASGLVAQEVERKFMHMVDTQANYALQKLARGDSTLLDGKMRSGWTRFILSLLFRNPEAVSTIKRQMVGVWEGTLENMRINYGKVRYVGDPLTFEEFVARTESVAPYKAALYLLQEIIDNPRIGPTIFDMRWSRASLAGSKISLLTSDRPLDMPHGLG
jgi:hypothetical protein